MATASEMKELSVDELKKRATDLREDLFNKRVKHRTGALESSADLGKTRKDLARVLTVLSQKEKAAKEAAKAKK